jgi:hypothetical protein
MKKSNALKNVSISPIEQTIDEAMEHLPTTLDLSLPENRSKFRLWMVRVCGIVATENAREFSKAAASAIEEAAALAINPKYHVERKKSREKYKAMRAMTQVSERPSTKAEIDFHRMSDAAVKM